MRLRDILVQGLERLCHVQYHRAAVTDLMAVRSRNKVRRIKWKR